jgi:hypothetical protein
MESAVMGEFTLDRFGRDTSHLRDSTGLKPVEFATDCIAAVEDLFGRAWLEGADGHRLQTLWKRKDWLATNELFGLGKTIIELTRIHRKWLVTTAKKIKSNIENSHGFITEILTCGSIRARSGKVAPASGNQKGYDFVVDFPSGFKYFISIKSQAMSLHETEFHRLSDLLKDAFAERVRKLGVCARLVLFSDSYIQASTFEYLIDFVRNKLKRYDSYNYKGCTMRFYELEPSQETFASSFYSHAVLVYCPQHRNALKNARDKLTQAGENLRAQLPLADNYFRILWVRVHSSTELSVLKEACESMLEEHENDYGFDGVFFFQPSVTREGSNSVINTYFVSVMAQLHQGFNCAVADRKVDLLTVEIPVGSLSLKPSEMYIFGDQGRAKIPEGTYVYQKADLYHLLKREGDALVGTFSSPASGVHHHLVHKHEMGEALFSALQVDVDETLII